MDRDEESIVQEIPTRRTATSTRTSPYCRCASHDDSIRPLQRGILPHSHQFSRANQIRKAILGRMLKKDAKFTSEFTL